jgi:hypothetical protein
MPGTAALGKLFFSKKCGAARNSAAAYARRLLVVGQIGRRKSRRGREYLVAVNENAAVAPRQEFVFV